MKPSSTQYSRWSYATLCLSAMIWGGSFIFQKIASGMVEPLLFNALRCALSALTLFPFLIISSVQDDADFDFFRRDELKIGAILGVILWAALGLQQYGITTSTASKAAVITGLYVVLAPIVMRILFDQHLSKIQIALAGLGAIGLFLLISGSGNVAINSGDLWLLLGSVIWAIHLSVLAQYHAYGRTLPIALIQMLVCCFLSGVSSTVVNEHWSWGGVYFAIPALVYTGLLSGGIAFTLQVYGQNRTSPFIAGIILSFEAIFGVWAGWYFLKDPFSMRNLIGAALIMVAITLIELTAYWQSRLVRTT